MNLGYDICEGFVKTSKIAKKKYILEIKCIIHELYIQALTLS